MNLIKRSRLSITRKPAKTIILLLLFFILGNFISGAVTIREAVFNTIDNLFASVPAVASIEIDHDGLSASWMQGLEPDFDGHPIPEEIIRQIGALEYVRAFEHSLSSIGGMASGTFIRDLDFAFPACVMEDLPEGMAAEDLKSFVFDPRKNGAPVASIDMRGVFSSTLIEIDSGVMEVSVGRLFTDSEVGNHEPVALISTEFAEANNLQVGSTFTIELNAYDMTQYFAAGSQNQGGGPDGTERRDEWRTLYEEHELTVIGILAHVEATSFGSYGTALSERIEAINQIFIPNGLLQEWVLRGMDAKIHPWSLENSLPAKDRLSFASIFVLYDPRDLPAFSKVAEALLPPYFVIGDFSGNFHDMENSMEQML